MEKNLNVPENANVLEKFGLAASIMDAASIQATDEENAHVTELGEASAAGKMNIEALKAAMIAARRPIERDYRKIGRNEPCPCGSGKKYKNCCLKTGEFEGYHRAPSKQ